MKNFVLLTFSDAVQPQQIIDIISNERNRFTDFSSPTEAIATGFSDVAKEVPYIFDKQNQLLSIDFKTRKKSIPASVIKERLEEEKERLFSQYRTRMTKKEEREFKEEIIAELMPHAYPKTSVVHLYWDFQSHIIYASVTNSDTAVEILSKINQDLSDTFNITLEMLPVSKDVPFCSTMRNVLLNNYFNSEQNLNSDYKLIPNGSYVVAGEGQVNLNNSKIKLNNISSESNDLKQALNGSTTRLVSSIGFDSEVASFTVSENLNFTSVQFHGAAQLPKFNPDEMSIEEYLKGNLILSINNMSFIYNSVTNLLNIGNELYGQSE